MTEQQNARMVVVYDGDCPFCSNFVQLMALRKAVGTVELVDARSGDARVADLLSRGFDLDEGMAVTFGDKVYYGDDAVVLISSLTPERGFVGRLIASLLKDPRRARILYPFMKAGRRLVLTILGRPLISSRVPDGRPTAI